MALREYEITIVVRADLAPDTQKTLRDRVRGLIEQRGGTVLHLVDLGRRTLGYEIAKQTKGFYWYCNFAADGGTVAELERFCRLDEGVVRFLSIQVADHVDVGTRQQQQEADLKRLQNYFGVVLLKGSEGTSESIGQVATPAS